MIALIKLTLPIDRFFSAVFPYLSFEHLLCKSDIPLNCILVFIIHVNVFSFALAP